MKKRAKSLLKKRAKSLLKKRAKTDRGEQKRGFGPTFSKGWGGGINKKMGKKPYFFIR